MLEKINIAIKYTQQEIVRYETIGMKAQAVEELENMMLLVRLREAYKSARERGLI